MQVVLAANDLPSINDVTYSELIEIISKVTKINFNKFLKLSKIFSNSVISVAS
jgi:hypothetical protein